MLPYPSGEPHMGHLKNYTMGDVLAHYRRRNGMRVLHPMGYDAFGLPAENHAIKTGEHPARSTDASIEEFRRQFRSWGISIDWRREFGTHEPELLPLDAVDLPEALRARARLPQAGAGQVVPEGPDRARQRAGDRRRAASAAARWSWSGSSSSGSSRSPTTPTACWRTSSCWSRGRERVITMQRNWIGRSEGAEVIFRCEEPAIDFPVFTTRPDTLFGATFFVLAPEHPDLERLVAGTEHEQRGAASTCRRR